MPHRCQASGHGRERPTRRALGGALAVTICFFAVEVAGGLLSGSLALLSDAGHMLADIFAIVLSLIAVRLGSRPPTAEKTYGYYRLEILCALGNGVLLCLVALWLFAESWARLEEPRAIDSGAWGYVSKNDGEDALIDAVRRVIAGEFVLSPEAREMYASW